jgi:hypothetical protein
MAERPALTVPLGAPREKGFCAELTVENESALSDHPPARAHETPFPREDANEIHATIDSGPRRTEWV